MKLKLFAAIAASAALMMSCREVINVAGNMGGNTVVASGASVKQDRPISDINEIDVSTGISVLYLQSPTLKLTVEAPENIQPCISTEIKDGELIVKAKKSFSSSNGAKIQVTVMAPNVKEFDVSSGASLSVKGNYTMANASVDIDVSSGASFAMESLVASAAEVESGSGASVAIGNIKVSDLEASSSGGASMSLSGSAVNVKLKASGGASLSASGLKAESGIATAGGGASLSSNIRNASVSSSGGGSVNNR